MSSLGDRPADAVGSDDVHSFLLGILGTYIGRRDTSSADQFAGMELRALTGAGAEKATTAH